MAQVESARMVTPEAVALEFRTANLGSRILAYLIDMVVVVAGILAGLFAVALIGQASDVVVPDWVALTIVLVLLPSWWLGYFIAFETLWRGPWCCASAAPWPPRRRSPSLPRRGWSTTPPPSTRAGSASTSTRRCGRSCCERPACPPAPARPWPCSWPTRRRPPPAPPPPPGAPPRSSSP